MSRDMRSFQSALTSVRRLSTRIRKRSGFATINMARHRFGLGEYKYYQAPPPESAAAASGRLYPELALTANRWLTLGHEERYPVSLDEFLGMCHAQGQERSTPLILKYEEGGYNCLHQDLYGDEFFPFQVVFVLNEKEVDYTGGEFLLIAAAEGTEPGTCDHVGTRSGANLSDQPSSRSGNARVLPDHAPSWRRYDYVGDPIQPRDYFS